jgi:hypothetical protein
MASKGPASLLIDFFRFWKIKFIDVLEESKSFRE